MRQDSCTNAAFERSYISTTTQRCRFFFPFQHRLGFPHNKLPPRIESVCLTPYVNEYHVTPHQVLDLVCFVAILLGKKHTLAPTLHTLTFNCFLPSVKSEVCLENVQQLAAKNQLRICQYSMLQLPLYEEENQGNWGDENWI